MCGEERSREGGRVEDTWRYVQGTSPPPGMGIDVTPGLLTGLLGRAKWAYGQ